MSCRPRAAPQCSVGRGKQKGVGATGGDICAQRTSARWGRSFPISLPAPGHDFQANRLPSSHVTPHCTSRRGSRLRVPPGPPRHTWPQTQLRSSREPRHGAAAGEPCPQPRAEAASGSPSPSVSNPAAVRLDGVFPLSHAGRALGAGRQQRRGTASGTGPAPSGVNARGGLRQDGGIRSARGHRVLRCAHRPAAPPP